MKRCLEDFCVRSRPDAFALNELFIESERVLKLDFSRIKNFDIWFSIQCSNSLLVELVVNRIAMHARPLLFGELGAHFLVVKISVLKIKLILLQCIAFGVNIIILVRLMVNLLIWVMGETLVIVLQLLFLLLLLNEIVFISE